MKEERAYKEITVCAKVIIRSEKQKKKFIKDETQMENPSDGDWEKCNGGWGCANNNCIQ